MAVASLYGGLALANAGLGAVHGLAGPIGGRFLAPHGAVCAVLLPQVMDTNLRALGQRAPASEALRRYNQVAQWLTGNPGAVGGDGVEWVRKLVADLQIKPLGLHGIRAEHIADLVAGAANASSMKANPIALTAEELTEILLAAI
jgi:alcohol dehydrogenase class IV